MIPVNFTYVDATVFPEEKIRVTIIGECKHYFTGETIYKLRLEGERDWINEHFYKEVYVKKMLEKRVDEN